MIKPSDAKEKADLILEEWDDVCRALGIEHFLVFGTCLGMVRDGGYIKGDKDIDVGIRKQGFPKLYSHLLEGGFTSQPPSWIQKYFNPDAIEKIACGTHVKFFKYDILLDVWMGLNHDPHHKAFLGSFDKVIYEGREYNVPQPVEDYLKMKYEENWRVPLRAQGGI